MYKQITVFQKLLSVLLALVAAVLLPVATMQPVHASSYGEVQLSPSYRTTYAACTAYFTPAASATDIFTLYGSSTKTIQIQKIYFSSTVSSGSVSFDKFYLVKRSGTNSGGTSASLTGVPLDSANAAATATNINNYTANPSGLGTAVGNVQAGISESVFSGGTAVSFNNGGQILFDADKYGQAITLRGTSQGIALNYNGVSFNGTPSISICVVWTEY